MLGCAIDVIRSVDGMKPILMDFMLLGSVILALFPCLLTIIIGNVREKCWCRKWQWIF